MTAIFTVFPAASKNATDLVERANAIKAMREELTELSKKLNREVVSLRECCSHPLYTEERKEATDEYDKVTGHVVTRTCTLCGLSETVNIHK